MKKMDDCKRLEKQNTAELDMIKPRGPGGLRAGRPPVRARVGG